MAADPIEAEIIAKNLPGARVTPQHIESVIATEHYFTAAQGAIGAHIVEYDGQEFTPQLKYPESLTLLSICVLTLVNGYTVVGTSACAAPENYDRDLGRKIALRNAMEQVWPLEGYLLKQRLAYTPPAPPTEPPA